jgi:hypothetical protein
MEDRARKPDAIDQADAQFGRSLTLEELVADLERYDLTRASTSPT